MKKKYLYLIIAAGLLFSACSNIPLINRKQVLLLPESQLVSMGITNYNDFLDTSDVISSGRDANNVEMVGRNIANAVERYLRDKGLEKRLKNFNWEFKLVDNDVPNAWCMPGGKVCFYSGILPYTQNIDGIAVVMGHEIAHAVARHGNERMTQQLTAQAGGLVLQKLIKQKPEATQNAFMQVYSVGASLGLILPYSRKHEYEADELGLMFMAMAGYNPSEAVEFWERMSRMGGQKPLEFLSTHPSDAKRIENLKKILPEAMKHYNANKK
ncbi:MAG: M48 family metallopeptidase [Bacteroidales bacterium]|nr:M48 family metallopeptidase [Bacteroidales bacterium]